MATISQKISNVLVGIFGSRNQRLLDEMIPIVEQVGSFEPKMQRLSDDDLRKKTGGFRERLARGETLDDILPEAFAVVREASRRVIWTPDPENPQPMRHFDVQIIGGIVLHRGKIAEMATGEGKTLVATLAVYLNALEGKGVHVVTVNDYLAHRDRDWTGPLYEFLGLTAGVIQHDQEPSEKRAAYACDVTFGQHSEFGFDYLRDNMCISVEQQTQLRGLNYAIVDEVDSVLVDEARTPLIISGASEESTEKYYQADRVAARLQRTQHFEVKEKEQSVYLTEEGTRAVEKLLGVENIYAGWESEWPHHIEQALRAHNLYKRDVDYVSKAGEVIIVDEFTGRLMPGRRWSDGLHQAIEAKEHLRIKEENQTLATITYQNFFRMYKKLAGMTGTAMTEAAEFDAIYKLDVVVMPTNRPLIRTEYPDVVYGTQTEKFDAIEEEIVRQHATGRPLLVGTVSIEKSEHLSERLLRRGIKHEVLNAKHHEREAQIIAKAGHMGNVTISTNMAGRGTDIVLGGFTPEQLLDHWKERALVPKHLRLDAPADELRQKLVEHWATVYLDEKTRSGLSHSELEAALERYWRREGLPALKLTDRVADLGGLHVIGTERHEARRIDNQLRGRAGRQGDPGCSRFFLSLEDDLMRIFASDRVAAILRRIGMSKGMALENPMVTRSIERAQKKVEEHNFDIRKHLLEYDEIMDEQRKAIYGQRQAIIESQDVSAAIAKMMEDCLLDELDRAIPTDDEPEMRNFRPLAEWAQGVGAKLETEEWRSSGYPALRDIFAGRAAESCGDAADAPRILARRVMAIFVEPYGTFREWDVTGLETWARSAQTLGRRGAVVSADAILARVADAVVRRCVAAAREAYKESDIERVIEVFLEDATARFLPPSQPPPEWDLDGLARWCAVLGFSLPVNQWKDDEPSEEELGDYEQTRRDDIRARMLERARQHVKSLAPADVVARLVETEAKRLLGPAPEGESPSYKPLASWLARAMNVPVSAEDIEAAVSAEIAKVEGEISDHAARAAAEPHELARNCFGDLFDAFMFKDLSDTTRDLTRLSIYAHRKFGIQLSPFDLSKLEIADISTTLIEKAAAARKQREEEIGAEKMRVIEKFLLLQKMDMKWKDHLLAMDHLKSGIGMRGYAQVDPKVEYTREARKMFDEMQTSLREEVTDLVLKLDIRGEERGTTTVWRGASASHPDAAEGARFERQRDAAAAGSDAGDGKPRPLVSVARVGRNQPCPCGSGKKYKNCCGRQK